MNAQEKTASFSSVLSRMNITIIAFAAAIIVAVSGTLMVLAPHAGASGTYVRSYSTSKACATAQRSIGHSSNVRIVDSCYESLSNCYGIQCSVQYTFSYRYV